MPSIILRSTYCSSFQYLYIKSQGGYLFDLFKYDSFRVVSGYRSNMGYLRLTSALMFCSCGFLLSLPCPYPVGDSSFVYCGGPILIKDFNQARTEQANTLEKTRSSLMWDEVVSTGDSVGTGPRAQ